MAESTYLLLDDVDLSVEEPRAAPAFAVAGYVNGKFENWPAIVAKYGHTGKYLLSIDTQGNPNAGAQALDCEKYDATLAQAPGWAKATQAAGKHFRDLRWYPKIYTSAGNVAALISDMAKAGFKRDEYKIWSAHYTGKAHICGAGQCEYPQADATQWTDAYQGVNLDASLCSASFFDGPPPVTPPAPPKPVVESVKVPKVIGLTVAKAVADLEAAGLKCSVAADKPGSVINQHPDEGTAVSKGAVVVVVVEAPKPVAPPVAPEPPVEPPKPVSPVAPVVVVPEPVPAPEEAPKDKPAVLVYVQEVLPTDYARKLGLPAGTIMFIPHTVEGA